MENESIVNERLIKLSGKFPTLEHIPYGKDVSIIIGGEKHIATCVKTEGLDQQDGTINLVYTLKYLNN